MSSRAIDVGCCLAVLCTILLGCDRGPTPECQSLEKSRAKLEGIVAQSLKEQGIDEPALIDGQPNPKAFDDEGDIIWSGDRAEWLLALGNVEHGTESCAASKK